MKNINKCLLFCLISAMSGANQLQAKVMDKIVAKVNGEPIMSSEYTKNKNTIVEQYKKAMPGFFTQKNAQEELSQKVLDQMIDDILLKQKAKKMKIKVYARELDKGVNEIKKRFSLTERGEMLDGEMADKAFKNELDKENLTLADFREKIRGQILVKKLIDQTIRPTVKLPTEKEIRAFFDKVNYIVKGDTASLKNMPAEEQQDMLAVAMKFKELTAERLRVRHIFIKIEENASFLDKNKSLKRARDIKKKLDKGEDFEDLAKLHSDDKESALRGGDLGYVFKGLLPEELETEALSMQVGKISKPVKTKFGYHIIKVEERKAEQKLKFEQVSNELGQLLAAQNFKEDLLKFVEGLKAKAKIKIFTDKK
ncbi:MAG: peptidylprolyl isomerase [Elusimicrobiales bacterium]|nr:peptidylprolyl isomerase [Elusimicrobiales bacterium]MCK5357563.1 peptidylprolyl isomerase [Elusimicrobiales bacterium]